MADRWLARRRLDQTVGRWPDPDDELSFAIPTVARSARPDIARRSSRSAFGRSRDHDHA